MMARIAVIVVVLGLIGVALPAWADEAAPTIGVRYSVAPEKVRVVLDLPNEAAYVDLSSPTQAQVKVDVALPAALPEIAVTDPVVAAISVAPDAEGKALLTVKLNKARKITVFPLPALTGKPPRLVLDVIKRFRTADRRELSPGVAYTRIETQTDTSYSVVHVLEADTRDPHVRVDVVAAQGERERVAEMTARTGAVGGVNAGFFREGTRPVGLLKVDGHVLSMPIWSRAGVAFPRTGTPEIGHPTGLWRITLPDNTVREWPDVLDASAKTPVPDTVVYLGNSFPLVPATVNGLNVVLRDGMVAGRGTEVTQLLPGDIGLRLGADDARALDGQFTLGAAVAAAPVLTPDWADYPAAVAAGPRLLRDGQVYIGVAAERIRNDIALGRPARTALGLTAKGVLILVAVEGPSPYGGGATLEELAALLKDRGAVDGINLDGGGSTSMAIENTTVNASPGVWVRPVASGILVFDDRVKRPDASGDAEK